MIFNYENHGVFCFISFFSQEWCLYLQLVVPLVLSFLSVPQPTMGPTSGWGEMALGRRCKDILLLKKWAK